MCEPKQSPLQEAENWLDETLDPSHEDEDERNEENEEDEDRDV